MLYHLWRSNIAFLNRMLKGMATGDPMKSSQDIRTTIMNSMIFNTAVISRYPSRHLMEPVYLLLHVHVTVVVMMMQYLKAQLNRIIPLIYLTSDNGSWNCSINRSVSANCHGRKWISHSGSSSTASGKYRYI